MFEVQRVGPRSEVRAQPVASGVLSLLLLGTVLACSPVSESQLEPLGESLSALSTSGPNLLVPRSGHTATVLADGRILIAGGENSAGLIRSAEIYDPQTGTITQAGNMVTQRVDHTATLLQ